MEQNMLNSIWMNVFLSAVANERSKSYTVVHPYLHLLVERYHVHNKKCSASCTNKLMCLGSGCQVRLGVDKFRNYYIFHENCFQLYFDILFLFYIFFFIISCTSIFFPNSDFMYNKYDSTYLHWKLFLFMFMLLHS